MKKIIRTIMVAVIICALTPSITTTNARAPPMVQVDIPLIYGILYPAPNLDPHMSLDRISINSISQITEGLFASNLRSDDVEIVPRLAAGCGTWNANATELTVPLRENVTFHDGTAFNASAVKWNFDRLNTFIEGEKTPLASLYKPLEGVYPAIPLVINETVVNSEFEVTFRLNYPFVAFLPLLCFSGSAIMSPNSTPVDIFLEVGNDILVGTGPFMHVNSTTEKTLFEAYPEYYRGTSAVQHMEWVVYESSTVIAKALLNGTIDLGDVNTDFMDEYEASLFITVGEQMKSVSIVYMGMNNKAVNKTMRQAISYAIDYDYVIEELCDGTAVRMASPVPEGITHHNPDVMATITNVNKARQILLDAGYAQGLTEKSTDQQWADRANTNPIATYNYSYDYGNVLREDLGIIVAVNCEAIGIKVILTGMEDVVYFNYLLGDWDKLQLFVTSWRPAYNDPSVYINTHFSNTSLSNSAQVNDPWLQSTMMEALEDTNLTTRKDKYFAIQKHIVEDEMPWVFLYVSISQNILSTSISNWSCTPIGQMDFFSISYLGENTIIAEGYIEENCGFEAPWEYYIEPISPEDHTPPYYPSVFVQILIAAALLGGIAFLIRIVVPNFQKREPGE